MLRKEAVIGVVIGAILSLAILNLLAGCGKAPGPQSSWKAPTLAQFRKASEWGAKQEEDPSKLWTVCESGPCQVPPDWRGGPKIQVVTPLSLTAVSAYVSAELDEETLADVKAQFSNELLIGLIFEGTIWDLDTSYEAVITQGDLVIHPFQSSLDSDMNIWEDGVAITLECRFKIKDVDLDKPFWFSASQAVGDRHFQFKIDPKALGTEEFF